MNENERKQFAMHRDFFVKTQDAIQDGFYLEAIFREYAAIEGRLEVILGLIGAPCNKFADDKTRRNIKISHRVYCLKEFYTDNHQIINSKLDEKYFKNLEKWIKDRNQIVHGFYKNEIKYRDRSANNRKLAEKGLELTRMLYNEVKRLRRYLKKHTARLGNNCICSEDNCNLKMDTNK